ncbi:hypothetical protein AB0C70_26650 [Streptomyces sp. NPDC048564]|uniref:hypothetical protein n=1 Tax=unclassified Streptomyces TaxID=2593676 RepID=UPI0033D34275
MHKHHPQRLAFATATTAALTGDLLTDVNRDGKVDLPAAANGENDFYSLVTVLKGSALGMTTSGATTYGPIRIGISTGDDHPRLGMITAD